MSVRKNKKSSSTGDNWKNEVKMPYTTLILNQRKMPHKIIDGMDTCLTAGHLSPQQMLVQTKIHSSIVAVV